MKPRKPSKEAIPVIDTRYARYRLRIRRSKIHGLGVFAAETIPPKRPVIEYTGERIARVETARRVQRIGRQPARTRKFYIARLNLYWAIDAAQGGSGAERVNHCCNPNAKLRRSHGRLFISSTTRIRAGEELTLDYKYGVGPPYSPCHCGAPNCRGTINRK
ncbi:MAG TPA: SET domain-containing protein-lysine N-methyltransferase [Candidatus Acidoferrales bacterium]|nr:SET domain-containing protein-lysine N-methyltransferase [Candidatus Acidoferrales bacterium]